MSTTPTPWTAIPATGTQWPEGSWLLIGPADDNGASHTIAVVPPCDDDTHPGREHREAVWITEVMNQFAAFARELDNPRQRHHLLPYTPMIFNGPALHPTQVRAYALLAAANIPLPNPAGQRGFSYENVEEWEAKVLRSAARFERYIKEGEELPDGNTEV